MFCANFQALKIVNSIERNALLWYLINVNLFLLQADSGGQLWQVF